MPRVTGGPTHARKRKRVLRRASGDDHPLISALCNARCIKKVRDEIFTKKGFSEKQVFISAVFNSVTKTIVCRNVSTINNIMLIT